jgi:hypothetical protein
MRVADFPFLNFWMLDGNIIAILIFISFTLTVLKPLVTCESRWMALPRVYFLCG